jgi:AcrR family transcriptional regulator
LSSHHGSPSPLQRLKNNELKHVPPKRGHGGRPHSSRAGEVDTRLLDAATRLFLERGFEGTSFEQVAELAHAGKASLYARFESKETLFVAVVARSVERTLTRTDVIPAELALRERLVAVGVSIIEQSLRPDVVALMRVVVAESQRFPEIACHANNIGYEAGVRRVAEVIAARSPDSLDAAKRANVPAARFIDLVFLPHQMRALLGEDLEVLLRSAPRQIDEVITMLSATGLLDDWM